MSFSLYGQQQFYTLASQGRTLGLNCLVASRLSSQDMQKFHALDFAGNMSFLLTIGIMPFVMLMIFLTGMVGQLSMGERLLDTFLQVMPENISHIVTPLIEEATTVPSGSILAGAIISMLWSTSAIVEGLRNILNLVYRVRHTPHFIWTRILSIIQFLGIFCLILFALFFLRILPEIINEMLYILNLEQYSLQKVDDFALLTVLFITVSLLYYVIPNHRQHWSSVVIGAGVTSVGWWFFGRIFRLYVNSINKLNYIYGGLFSIVILQLFFYIVSIIFIFGAEFNYHLLLLYRKDSIAKLKQDHQSSTTKD